LRWPVPGALALAALAVVSPAATPSATMGTLHVAQRRRFAVAAAGDPQDYPSAHHRHWRHARLAITLVAAATAIFAAIEAVLLDRARAARRHQAAPSA
jgi:hypothetical protein